LPRAAPVGRLASLELPDKPSIAVLPFTNMSNDPEQETFVDGLTEDLITDLSRSAGLFVIARNSTFAYKGRSVDVRLAARDLGVRYVVEGSARRAAARVRINAQLIDAIGGDHIWAERYDSSLEDIFAVQDEVTAKIVEALVGRLAGQPARKRPSSLEAYDLCVR
ncbi:MAG: adenylate/guanylate cyclase domain-containing protein, partial [Mesorhizobium sp.]